MEGSESWQALLAQITSNSQERERIVQELNVNPVTITRWINQDTTPRLDNLRRLLNAVPERREALYDLLTRDFPALALHTEADEPVYEITSTFYADVLNMYVTTPTNMRFWVLSRMVLQYLLEQLDHGLQHVAVLLFKCQPDSQQKIRCIRSVLGVGTPPWSGNIDNQSVLLGAESFAGQVLLSGRPALIENAERYNGVWPPSSYSAPGQLHLVKEKDWHQIVSNFKVHRIASEMAAPVVRIEKSAATVYVCSTHTDAFQPPHLQLLQACAHLMTLAFAPEDFYAHEDIILHMMPQPWQQLPLLFQVPQRVLQLMRDTANSPKPLTRASAEQIAWQQVEEELIQLAASFENDA